MTKSRGQLRNDIVVTQLQVYTHLDSVTPHFQLHLKDTLNRW